MMFNVILIDDERPALNILQRYLMNYENIDIKGKFTSANSALEMMERIPIDIAFLDIEMPDINGIEICKRIVEINPDVRIVFITAYRDYAVEAFELNAFDYILKPLSKERLDSLIKKIINKPNNLTARSEAIIKVKCLGGFNVYYDGRPVKWRTAKTKELFAYLLHHQGQSVYRDKMVEDLWPDKDLQKARKILHTTIYNIRKVLKGMGIERALGYSGESYSLDLRGFYIDVLEFQKKVRPKEQQSEFKPEQLIDAVELYDGDYLAETDYSWALFKREELRKACSEALKRIYRYYLDKQDLDNSLIYLKRYLSLNPFDDEAHLEVLQIYGNLKDFSALKKYYRNTRKLYKEELNVEVSSEFINYYRSQKK